MDILLQPHFLATEARVRAETIVLTVQDTTSLNYTTHAATEEMGSIGSTANGPQGLHLHSTLTFSTQPGPTLREAIRRVAGLGGFLGRKGDGERGTQTRWIGLRRLDDIVTMWRVMTDATQSTVSSRMDSG